jgi:hypothetical protein
MRPMLSAMYMNETLRAATAAFALCSSVYKQ